MLCSCVVNERNCAFSQHTKSWSKKSLKVHEISMFSLAPKVFNHFEQKNNIFWRLIFFIWTLRTEEDVNQSKSNLRIVSFNLLDKLFFLQNKTYRMNDDRSASFYYKFVNKEIHSSEIIIVKRDIWMNIGNRALPWRAVSIFGHFCSTEVYEHIYSL